MHVGIVGLAFTAAATLLIQAQTNANPNDTALPWYPLRPGNSWTYNKESLEGDMDHPDFERWTTEQTVVSAKPDPSLGGILVTLKTRVIRDSMSPGLLPANNLARREPAESHLLIHQGCIYRLDGWNAPCAQTGPTECVTAFDSQGGLRPAYRAALLQGRVPPELCFPLSKGETWGKVPSTSPAGEDIWRVVGVDSDPFGAPTVQTFRLSSYGGGGISVDAWFGKGIGILQEVTEHHGTYDEDRQELIASNVGGATRTYQLKPARILPFSDEECSGPGWRHFAKADGAPFASRADCTAYLSHPR
jgi:hypothetical protein